MTFANYRKDLYVPTGTKFDEMMLNMTGQSKKKYYREKYKRLARQHAETMSQIKKSQETNVVTEQTALLNTYRACKNDFFYQHLTKKQLLDAYDTVIKPDTIAYLVKLWQPELAKQQLLAKAAKDYQKSNCSIAKIIHKYHLDANAFYDYLSLHDIPLTSRLDRKHLPQATIKELRQLVSGLPLSDRLNLAIIAYQNNLYNVHEIYTIFNINSTTFYAYLNRI